MTIQFNTDKSIKGSDDFIAPLKSQLEESLSRFSTKISRIEVHLSDEDGNKNGVNSIRCMIEARINGRQPVSITNKADTIEQALAGGIDKLTAMLDTIFGKLSDRSV